MSKSSPHNQRQLLNVCITLLLTLCVSACGGGGGGGDTPKVNNQASTTSIDSGNAMQILAEVSAAVLGTDNLTNSVDFSNSNVTVEMNMSNPTAMHGASVTSQKALAGIIINYTPIGPETVDCYVSGTQKIWGDLNDVNTLTAGDVLNIESNMCDDGYGEVIDGLLEMTIVNIDGDINSLEFLLEVEVKFADLMTTTDSESISFDGDISMVIDTLAPPLEKLEVSGNSFSINFDDKAVTMSNFLDTFIVDTSTFPIAWEQSAKGSLTSSEFIGTVNYETTLTLMGTGGSYPHSGELLVTGADGASLKLIVIDAENIQIDADYDGDKVIDETTYITWSELEGNS
ncbi:hypothetical protein RI844_07575 [Thalassotalea fonticola]|uniref:Lipocalin-like domain-containing protein n=1 Tax=Thalassotalea fonticola TaxID=3065649 RepID=A0ABZ0GUI8_9GAMM|nr:hypothetical protein RI844_07575 [Colwelliaceae bacterium S1-1]